MDFVKCREKTNQKDIPVSEKKRAFRLKNPKQEYLNKIIVDGCLFDKNSSERRCDFLFEILGEKTFTKVIYVELKGKNIAHAYEQLTSTINNCLKEHSDCAKECYIVASKVKPRIRPEIQSMKVKMKKSFNATLNISTNLKEITI